MVMTNRPIHAKNFTSAVVEATEIRDGYKKIELSLSILLEIELCEQLFNLKDSAENVHSIAVVNFIPNNFYRNLYGERSF